MKTDRRRFLKAGVETIGAAFAAAAGWVIYQFLAPAQGPGTAGKAGVPRGEVPVGGAHLFVFRGRPAVLLQPSPGRFIALSAVCTHLGCIVKWVPEEGSFLCPCHAARFSAGGAVLSGPPPKPLEAYPVSVGGQTVVVG